VALADDLVRWLAGLPTRARPMSPAQRLGRSIARRPVVAALLSTALLASCIAGWSAIERSRERFKGAAQQEELRRQNAAAELRRGFESLRAGNVAGAIDHITNTRSIDPVLANSLATRWLERRLHGERATLLEVKPADAGTRADLHSLAVSPDGRTVVVGGADGSLRILRDVDGQPRVQVILAHDEINDVCFSPDGRLFATAGQDGRVRWWSMDEPTSPDGETPPTGCPLYGVCFGADSASVFYGGEDRILRRFDLAAGTSPAEIHRFEAPEGESPEIEAMCQTGNTIVVACGAVLTAFNTADGRILWSQHRSAKNLQRSVFHALAISPTGDRIAAGGTDRELTILDIASGELLAAFPAHPNWIQACRFSADGKHLATACRDGAVRIFDASSGENLAKFLGHSGRVWDVDFKPDGGLLTAGADGTVRRWDQADSMPSSVFHAVSVPGHAITMLREAVALNRPSDNHRLVAVREVGMPLLVDLDGTHPDVIANADRPFIYSIAVDGARGRMAFGFLSEADAFAPLVLPLNGGPPIRTANVPNDDWIGSHVSWAPGGTLVTNSHKGQVLAWSPTLDRVMKITDVDFPSTRIEAAPLAPPRIAVAGKPGVIIRLDGAPRAGKAQVRLDDVGDTIAAMAWSPDGLLLACGLRNGSLHLFDGTTGKRVGSLAPHERQIYDIAWSSDGRVLITADADGLRISDVATLSTYDELRPGWKIETMCLAADGGWIAIGGRAAVHNPDEQARLAILDLDPR
jgi:WD40 repeat protein